MRLFFGVFLEPTCLDRLIDVHGRVRRLCPAPGIRWVKADQLHLTLQFLGPVSEERAADARACALETARATAPFAIELGGLGAFPSASRPSVLWSGVRAGGEPLVALAEDLGARLRASGFAIDARKLHPHVTLARIKDSRGGREVRDVLRAPFESEVGASRVDRFALVESKLGPGGSVYVPQEWFALVG